MKVRFAPVGFALAALVFATALPTLAQVGKPAAPSAAPTSTMTPQAAQVGACPSVPLASADAAMVGTPSDANAWGGARADGAATLSDRVVKYTIDATLDPVKHTVAGKQTLTWRNRSAQPVCSIYLHMYLNAFESEGSTFFTEERTRGFSFRSNVKTKDGDWGYIRLDGVTQGGQPARWTYVHPDNGPETDHTVVRIDLPTPVAPGASTALDMTYFDQLPRVVARTGYFGSFHLVGQWFPKIGVLELPGERGATAPRWNVHEMHLHSEFYADYGSYDVTLHVPKGYVVGATGELQGTPAEANGMVTHRYVQDDVHDFAWTADNRTAKPLEATWTHPGSPQVKVRVLYPPEYTSNAAPVLKATLDSLTYFSDTVGPYPYRTVTAVVPPYNAGEAGGMEYPTFFTADNVDEYKAGTINEYMLDFVTIHEFGHGYFYGILGSNEFEEPMLDEGVNEFWDDRMLRDRNQQLWLATSFSKRLGLAPHISAYGMERLGAMLDRPFDPLGANSWDRYSSNSYGTVYSRTATALHDLETQVGSQAMDRGMKLYYQRWKFRHPGLADFRDALAEGTGRADVVNSVFDNEVFNARRINDSVASLTSEEVLPLGGYVEQAGKRVEMTQDKVAASIKDTRAAWKKAHPKAKDSDGGAFPYRTTVMVRRDGADVPQVLQVEFADGTKQVVRFSGDQHWFRYSWIGKSKATRAVLDPQGDHGLDQSRLDNTRTLEPVPTASFANRIAAFMQNALISGMTL